MTVEQEIALGGLISGAVTLIIYAALQIWSNILQQRTLTAAREQTEVFKEQNEIMRVQGGEAMPTPLRSIPPQPSVVVRTRLWPLIPMAILFVISLAAVVYDFHTHRQQRSPVPSAQSRADLDQANAQIARLQSQLQGARNELQNARNQQPSGGSRIGTTFALQLAQLLNRLPKPCTIKFTAPGHSDEVASVISWVVSYGNPSGQAICSPAPSEAGPLNENAPAPLKPTTESGIIVHWDASFTAGQDVANALDHLGLFVRTSHRIPEHSPSNFIWIDVGPGSPWKS
jgi:hypothetical protein